MKRFFDGCAIFMLFVTISGGIFGLKGCVAEDFIAAWTSVGVVTCASVIMALLAIGAYLHRISKGDSE